MNKSEELAAKAARLRQRQDKAQDSTYVPTEARKAPRAVRVKPVRLTVDVPLADHAALAHWCLEAAQELGVARVHGQELVRALLKKALSDPDLRQHVTSDVAALRETQ